jgi:hypothetical protein
MRKNIQLGQWHHILASSVGPTLTIYFDDEKISGWFDVLDTAKSDFIYIGGIPPEAIQKLKNDRIRANNFVGMMKDIKIYNAVGHTP